jgi:hypothetical protein
VLIELAMHVCCMPPMMFGCNPVRHRAVICGIDDVPTPQQMFTEGRLEERTHE